MDSENNRKIGRGPLIAALIIFLAVAAVFIFFLARFIGGTDFKRASGTYDPAYLTTTPAATETPSPSEEPDETTGPEPTPDEEEPENEEPENIEPGEINPDIFVSEYVYMIRVSNGEVLCSKNGEDMMYPASMTKMMTAIIVLENYTDLNSPITVTQEDVDIAYLGGATRAGFEDGDTVTIWDALYGMMLPSGAEAAEALARTTFGSRDEFINAMNEKAAELGMTGTHFSNPTGLFAEDNYSTCRDIAALLLYCMNNQSFREIVGTSEWTTGPTSEYPEGIALRSTLFSQLASRTLSNGAVIEGGKTGTEDLAGKCLASFAAFDGDEYILVTAGAPLDGSENVQDAVRAYESL